MVSGIALACMSTYYDEHFVLFWNNFQKQHMESFIIIWL